MTPLLTAWMTSLVLITYREMPLKPVQQNKATIGYSKGGPCPIYPLPAPIPALYAPTFVVFGALGVLATADRFRPIATLMGWGFVSAMALNLFGLGANSCARGQTNSPTFASTGTPAPAGGTETVAVGGFSSTQTL